MTTPPAQIEQQLTEEINRKVKAVINAFEYVGVQCQNEARTNKTYKDQTGNLKSSVGYVVLLDGKVLSGAEFDSNEGGENGSYILESIMSKPFVSTGVALIVVAGMNYAAAVEARNFNVLTSAELLAEQLVPQLMQQLGFTTTK